MSLEHWYAILSEHRMAKRTTTSRKPTATRSRKPTSRKRPPPPAFELSLRPEHQRELFALALITIAAITIVFFIVGPAAAGAIGQTWVDFTLKLLGWGALMVPLALGLLGVAILWQERREDLQLTGATVLGTIMLLMSLLVLLEFALGPRKDVADQIGKGGGISGFTLIQLYWLIGRPATFLVYCVLGLAGILLTFNITLRELVTGMADSFGRFWVTIWSGSAGAGRRTAPRTSCRRRSRPARPAQACSTGLKLRCSHLRPNQSRRRPRTARASRRARSRGRTHS
jgi:DNA segregation ATPase FtsK/SpoIIIE, S-DNA-T family